MYFIQDKRNYSLVEREYSSNMDRIQLIAEVYSRPALWDLQSEEYKSRANIPQLWKEVATCMGQNVTVDECKRKWKNLRDAYRAEIKRIEIRIEKDILKGTYDLKNDYGSKWAYFEQMKFIEDIRKPRRSKMGEYLNISSNDTYDDMAELDEFAEFHDLGNIKQEPSAESNAVTSSLRDDTNDSQILASKETEKQQANKDNSLQAKHAIKMAPNCSQPQKTTMDDKSSCKCPKRSIDQVHFLEDLEREEQKLIKSTRLDISRSNDLSHVGDSDYNFLVSFLPQLKKMNELQNLQFRAQMTEFVFRIMSQSMTNHNDDAPIASQPTVCSNYNTSFLFSHSKNKN